MLDYRIDTFLTLCKCMNYRKTAEALHMSQPAVTQQIHYLENFYNCKLFSYANRKLMKTQAGQLLETYARAAESHERILKEKLIEKQVRTLHIGATKTIGDYLLSEYIYHYLADKDNALTVVVDNTEHLLKALEDFTLDFAIIEGFYDKDRFDSIELRREPFVGICSKHHPFADREIALDELLQETIIYREEGSGTRAILEQELSGYSESIQHFRRQICISSFPLILNLVKRGIGVSFVYKVLADSDDELATFTIRGEQVVREFNIVYLKYADQSESIRAFFGDE